MQHKPFEHQHVANTMENERFELQNVAKCCWNGSFQLQSAANSKETGQNRKSKNNAKAEKHNPQTIPDLFS